MRKHASRIFSAEDGESVAFTLETEIAPHHFRLSTRDATLRIMGRGRWRVACKKRSGKDHHAIRLVYNITFPPGSRSATKFTLHLRDQDGVEKKTTFYRPRGTEARQERMTGDLVIGVK